MKELDQTFWIQKTKIVHLFTIEHGSHGDYWLGEEWNEGLVVTFARDCHLLSIFWHGMTICCLGGMLEPHHFVTQPFQNPFPLLCMLSTPSNYSTIQAFLWKCWIHLPKTLMSLAETLSSVWSFFPLKLSTSPMPRTSHLELSYLCISFLRLAFLSFWKPFRRSSFILMPMLSFYWAFENPLMSFSCMLNLFKVAKTSISHPRAVENFMHHLPHVKWIWSLGSFVHFWTN